MACYNKEEVTVFVKTPLGIVELDYTEYHNLFQKGVIKADDNELVMPTITAGYIKKIIAMRNASDLWISAKRMKAYPNNKRLYISLKAFLRTLHIGVKEITEDGEIIKLELLDGDQDDAATLIIIPI